MKTIPLKKLVSFLDRELALSEFPKDDSMNGLQVEGGKTVRKVGLAVDACACVFRDAARKNIDFLLVHHGLIWGGLRAVSGIAKTRIQLLLGNDISLYACHLPLDWHPVYGNNAQLLKHLQLKKAGDFGAIARDDGKKQTTYKGMPLYYFAGDKNPGDTAGQGMGGNWYVVNP